MFSGTRENSSGENKRARGVGTCCGLDARFSGDHGKSVRCRGLAGAEIADWGGRRGSRNSTAQQSAKKLGRRGEMACELFLGLVPEAEMGEVCVQRSTASDIRHQKSIRI